MEDYNCLQWNCKYSIIIPHKNSFLLLLHLLDTIPDHPDFQVIVVDDHSKEEEVRQLKSHRYASNVSVYYDSEGGGAGKARNIGLEYATGKWLLFADADDYFTESIQELLDSYYDSDSDIIYFGTSSIYLDTGEVAYRHERNMALVNGFLSDPQEEDALRYYFTGPIAKMIRREIVDKYHIRFDEVIASNDVFFSISAAYKAKRISATNKVLYIITVSSGSLVNTFSQSHFDARLKIALKSNDFLRSIHKSKYQQSVLYFLAKSYQFGIKYFIYVIYLLVKHHSNLIIGINKIFSIRSVLQNREKSKYMVRQ